MQQFRGPGYGERGFFDATVVVGTRARETDRVSTYGEDLILCAAALGTYWLFLEQSLTVNGASWSSNSSKISNVCNRNTHYEYTSRPMLRTSASQVEKKAALKL